MISRRTDLMQKVVKQDHTRAWAQVLVKNSELRVWHVCAFGDQNMQMKLQEAIELLWGALWRRELGLTISDELVRNNSHWVYPSWKDVRIGIHRSMISKWHLPNVASRSEEIRISDLPRVWWLSYFKVRAVLISCNGVVPTLPCIARVHWEWLKLKVLTNSWWMQIKEGENKTGCLAKTCVIF